MNFASTKNISYWWNYRSMGRLWIALQVATGLLMATSLIAGEHYAFDSVGGIMETLIRRHLSRFAHANFCSIVFFIIILHIGKRVWNLSGSKGNLWKSGVALLVLVMGASFLGYVLPWRHISFWGATVITSLAGVLPFGTTVVIMIWGGFSLSTACLRRFFILHFLLPLVVMAIIIVHLILLHEYVSSSSVGNSGGLTFSNWYMKDIITFIGSIRVLLIVVVVVPHVFMDADNWFHANIMVTPAHIKPEWYFLFAYCILRCIPDKTIRVIGLVRSLLIVALIGIINSRRIMPGLFVILTWLRGAEVNDHMTLASQFASVAYFINI